jgi:head decoration protein D
MPTKIEKKTLGDVLLHEADNFYSRDLVTVGSGADLGVGHVVGKITASKKYVSHNPGASDGSEVVAGVLMQEAMAASADVANVKIVARHARVKRTGLAFNAAIDNATKRQTAVDGLKAIGILSDT